jgi:hypothetical protein
MAMLIAHASDLSGDDAAAFVHAAALAAAAGARLVTVSAGAIGSGREPDAPSLVARWGRPIDHAFVRATCCDEVLLGSHTEHVVRDAGRPVLSVPT